MAKEKEKKVSGEMNAEELENVAGGWCGPSGKSAPKHVKSVERGKPLSDGSYEIITKFQNGSYIVSTFSSNGKMLSTDYCD